MLCDLSCRRCSRVLRWLGCRSFFLLVTSLNFVFFVLTHALDFTAPLFVSALADPLCPSGTSTSVNGLTSSLFTFAFVRQVFNADPNHVDRVLHTQGYSSSRGLVFDVATFFVKHDFSDTFRPLMPGPWPRLRVGSSSTVWTRSSLGTSSFCFLHSIEPVQTSLTLQHILGVAPELVAIMIFSSLTLYTGRSSRASRRLLSSVLLNHLGLAFPSEALVDASSCSSSSAAVANVYSSFLDF